jgi:hypothetical protein
MFNSKKEFALALMSGRRFSTPRGNICYYDGSIHDNPFVVAADYAASYPMKGVWDEFANVTEIFEPRWYDNIPPQGILCWVSNNASTERTNVAIVIKAYLTSTSSVYRFERTGNIFCMYATPLTQDDFNDLRYVP